MTYFIIELEIEAESEWCTIFLYKYLIEAESEFDAMFLLAKKVDLSNKFVLSSKCIKLTETDKNSIILHGVSKRIK